MIKIRITYDSSKPEEAREFIDDMRLSGYRLLSESREYKGRGKSVYSNIYLDIESESMNG